MNLLSMSERKISWDNWSQHATKKDEKKHAKRKNFQYFILQTLMHHLHIVRLRSVE